MTYFSLVPEATGLCANFPFIKDGKEIAQSPRCGITLAGAGSMRFKNQENTIRRDTVFSQINIALQRVVGMELIHSKIVYAVKNTQDVASKRGDGLISITNGLVLSVTVADCMPIYLYEPKTGCFGVLHSGWKGTGIILEALEQAKITYGAKAEDFLVIIGPHINDCCYEIDAMRRAFFEENFTPDCINKRFDAKNNTDRFFLSLAKANLFLLKKAGVQDENISVCKDCTSCTPFLSSFRVHSSKFDSLVPLEERVKSLSVMAAYITR